MSLSLTPDMLAGAYEFLRTTEPFKAWRLPHADEVGFAVVRDPAMFADFGVENGVPVIRVSEARNGHSATLLATMAHEMCHLRQEMTGDRGHHTAGFKRMAARVCRVHGFDLKTF
jgi:hypothetical protein